MDGDYLELEKTIYGLVQAARAWWKEFIRVLTQKMGFEPYPNDNCLLRRKTNDGIVFMVLYVDDCFVVGDKAAIDKTLNDISTHFDIKREASVKEFIGCDIIKRSDSVELWQPVLIKKLLGTFADNIKGMKSYKTPAACGA
jgi:hypothetical protein